MYKKIIISLFIGCLISALMLYLAFRNVQVDELLKYLQTINYWWLFPTIGIIALTFVLRVVRWMIILKDVCKLSFWEAFHPTMIGFMMNCILPGRVGELARPVLLKQKRGIPIATGFATLATDRIFDLIFLIFLFALPFSTIAGRSDLGGEYLGVQLDSQTIQSLAIGMIRLSIVILVFIGLMSFGRTRSFLKKIISKPCLYIDHIISPAKNKTQRINQFFINIIDNFAMGLSLVGNPLQLALCSILTLIIWILTAVSYSIFALGCPGIALSPVESTAVMVIICFVIALPSVPGFWGLWEAGGIFALALYGISEKDALGFTLVNHAAHIFPTIGIGLISALITSVNILQITKNTSTAKH